MAEGDIGAVIDTLEFDPVNAQYPTIVRVSSDICAIAYTGDLAHGQLVTVSINAAGEIGAAVIDSKEFYANGTYDIKIINVSGNIYAIAYKDEANDGQLVTVSIDAEGAIGEAVIDSFEFDAGAAYENSLLRINENVVAIVYRDATVGGKIVTVLINMAGGIGAAVIDSLYFDAVRGIKPSIAHVSGDIYAIAYQGVDDDGWIKTVSINAAGEIGAAIIDSLEFDAVQSGAPSIAHVSGNIYAIAYQDIDGDGQVKTIDIETAILTRMTQHLMIMGVG